MQNIALRKTSALYEGFRGAKATKTVNLNELISLKYLSNQSHKIAVFTVVVSLQVNYFGKIPKL